MKRVSLKRIIDSVDENFKDVLSKPRLKTLALVAIAISLASRLKINEIARKMPTDVKHQKSKQTRLPRFLKKPFPLLDMMFSWSRKVNLFCGGDDRVNKDKDDPAFIISDTDDLIDLIYGKRTQIEMDQICHTAACVSHLL